MDLSTNDAFRYHWTVWHLTGIHRPPGIRKSLYLLYAVSLNLLVTILFPFTLFANLFHTNSLQQLCENLTITITDTIANLKFLNVFLVHSKLLLIKDILESLDKRATTRAEQLALRKEVARAQFSFRIFFAIYSIGTGLSLIKVAIAQQRSLLFPAWFYVDWSQSDFWYSIVFSYQLVALMVQAIQDCANDSYPPAYLCVLTGHMRALELRVRCICSRKVGRGNAEQLQANYRELVECIRDHLTILKLHAIIQDIISLACLAQFICSALVQCTVGLHFLYIVDSQDVSAQILSIIFFVAVTLEVLIICYFGHLMRAQSEALTVAFYSCDWLDQLPVFKRDLIIVLMRTLKPCTILAGRYIPLDMPTFVKLMKYSYSAFTLLMRFK